MPPQPSDLASAAPHRLRARSSRSETIAVYFSRIHSTTCASGIAENIAENAAASQDQVRYFIVERALTSLVKVGDASAWNLTLSEIATTFLSSLSSSSIRSCAQD